MDSVQIRKYKPDDHDDVRRITNQRGGPIFLGLEKRKNQLLLAVLFLLGSLIWNILAGILILTLLLCGQAGIILRKYHSFKKHFFGN